MVAGAGIVIRAALADELDELGRIDEEAGCIFAQVGISFDLEPGCAFLLEERQRWQAALSRGLVWVAVGQDAALLGFAVMGEVDGEAYLDQLAVRPRAMRRGIGRTLLERAGRHAGSRPLLLTTYAQVPWNEPYYERCGFERLPEELWGPELRAVIAAQRAVLPRPELRVAMRKRP